MRLRKSPSEPLLPWLLPAVVAGAGFGTIWSGRLRLGGYVVAAGLLLAAVLRAVLPPRAAGALAIRGRLLDVLMWLALAVVVAVGAWAVNIPPPGA